MVVEIVSEPRIVGAFLGGMYESIFVLDRELSARPPGLSYVIVPERRGSPILAGIAAQRSRVNLGLPWPPESRIVKGLGSMRAPVPILWRGLTQRRDGFRAMPPTDRHYRRFPIH